MAQIHGRMKKGKVDGYPSSALRWLPEDPSDTLSIFPFLSVRVFEPLQYSISSIQGIDSLRFIEFCKVVSVKSRKSPLKEVLLTTFLLE
jgi:hypothetical protein